MSERDPLHAELERLQLENATLRRTPPTEGVADELQRLKDLLREVQLVQLQPGDMLLLQLSGRLPREHADRMREAFQSVLSGVEVVIVGPELSIAGVIRMQQ